jgi:hypothetical protein
MPGMSILETAELITYIDTSFGVTFARFTGRAVAMLSCKICICASPATFLGKLTRNYRHISAVKHRRRKGYYNAELLEQERNCESASRASTRVLTALDLPCDNCKKKTVEGEQKTVICKKGSRFHL